MSLSAPTVIVAGIAWLGVLFAVAVIGERSGERSGLRLEVLFGRGSYSRSAGGLLPRPGRSMARPTQAAALFGGRCRPDLLSRPHCPVSCFSHPSSLCRLVSLSRSSQFPSIADFIASRFGKSSVLAATVTGVALLGIRRSLYFPSAQSRGDALFGALSFGRIEGNGACRLAGSGVLRSLADGDLRDAVRHPGGRRPTSIIRGLVLANGRSSPCSSSGRCWRWVLSWCFRVCTAVRDLVENTAPTGFFSVDTFITLASAGCTGDVHLAPPVSYRCGRVPGHGHLRAARWLFRCFWS